MSKYDFHEHTNDDSSLFYDMDDERPSFEKRKIKKMRTNDELKIRGKKKDKKRKQREMETENNE